MNQPSEKDIYKALLAKRPDYRVTISENNGLISVFPPEHYETHNFLMEFFYDESDGDCASFWLAGIRYSTLSVFSFTTAEEIANHYISLVENLEIINQPEIPSKSI